jgi:hypothetical protein
MKRALVIFTFFVSFVVVSSGSPKIHAATPSLAISWHSNSYVPSDFSGKALPTTGSQMTASVVLINNGKVVDLGSELVYWYLNDTSIEGGFGKTRVSFEVPGVAPSTLELRVKLPNYSGGLLKTISIPVVQPEAVIQAPFAGAETGARSFDVIAAPFFFNVLTASDLDMQWTANGMAPEGVDHPETLTINLPPDAPAGALINLSLTVKNPINVGSTARSQTSITVK